MGTGAGPRAAPRRGGRGGGAQDLATVEAAEHGKAPILSSLTALWERIEVGVGVALSPARLSTVIHGPRSQTAYTHMLDRHDHECT